MTETATMTRTTTEIAMPPAVMNGTPATTSPRIATTTMPPATTTGLPAVASAEPTDSATGRPRAR